VNTLAVASSPNAVTMPATSCSTPTASVSRGDVCHAQRAASAAVRGAVRATASSPAFAADS
jgi:hypothetical protein